MRDAVQCRFGNGAAAVEVPDSLAPSTSLPSRLVPLIVQPCGASRRIKCLRGKAESEAEEMRHAQASCHSARTASSASCGRCCRAQCCEFCRRCKARQGPHRHGAHQRRGIARASARLRRSSVASPELPMAISTLRMKRSRPVRLTGEPEKSLRNAASSSRASSASLGATSSSRALSFASRPSFANLFHGHTARQSSQP